MKRVPTDVAALVLRVVAGAIFLPHGWSKVAAAGGTTAFATDMATSYGIPTILGHLAAYSELVGAILLIVGLVTRLDAFLLAATMFVAAFVVQLPDALYEAGHGPGRIFVAIRGIELPLAMFGICCALLLTGGGRYSLDHLAARFLPKRKTAAEAAAVRV